MRNHRGKHKMNLAKRRAVTGYLFIMPFVVGFLFFILMPLVSSVRMSFSDVSLSGGEQGISMSFAGWKHYLYALTIDKDFNRLLAEAVGDLLVDVPCILIFSLILAVILNRRFPGRGLVRAIFFMPVILVSGVVLRMDQANALLAGVQDLQQASTDTTITTTVETLLLGSLGSSGVVRMILDIINHFYDIVVSSSIQMVIFLSALQDIPPAVYESADMEGCSKWERLWLITIPMLSPMILVNWIYTIVDRFIRADNKVMQKILDAINVTLDYGYSSAMAWLYCICMLLLIGISCLIISRMVYYYD